MKDQFPIFSSHPDLVYLDNAASVQKPRVVLDAVQYFLTHEYANIHRGAYALALQAEERWWSARKTVATVLWCSEKECIFTANSTASVNLLTISLHRSKKIQSGDVIILSILEHHANIVPRQILTEMTGAEIVYLWLTADWHYDWSVLETIDTSRIKVISLSLVSNVTGAIMDLSPVKKLSNRDSFFFVIDASQAVPHVRIDVQQLDVDFLYFTGHKLGALMGIGVLYGREAVLKDLLPGLSGGGAIQEVTTAWHSYQWIPDAFEAGTPNVVAAVSLETAFQWIADQGSGATFAEKLDIAYLSFMQHETVLMEKIIVSLPLLEQAWLHLLWPKHSAWRIGVFSFACQWLSATTVWNTLAKHNICVRTGAHCAHLLHHAQSCGPTLRMSLWRYNDLNDIDAFLDTIINKI